MNGILKEPGQIKISACTIAKNEAETIARSIKSYRDFVDEIIVVDTGSIDNTAKIAESLGAKVLHFKWCDDFAAAKNCALDAATGNWILFLDADEYFCENCGESVRKAIEIAEESGNNAIGCRMVNINTSNNYKLAEIFSTRLFKAGIRYRYPVHEEVDFKHGMKLMTVDKDWFYLYHTGYSSNLMAEKNERNLHILLNQVERETDSVRKAVYHSYISDSYYSMGKYKEAIEEAKLFIEAKGRYKIQLIGCDTRSYLNIIWSLERSGSDFKELDHWITKLEESYPDYPDSAYSRARFLLRQRRFRKAISKFMESLDLLEKYNGTEICSVQSDRDAIFRLCGICSEGLLDIPGALDYDFKAVEENPYNVQTMQRLVYLIRDMPKAEVDDFLKSIFDNGSNEQRLTLMRALMANYMAEPLIRCYSYYHILNGEKGLEANIEAFIMAGKGNYDAASGMFSIRYQADKEPDTAMRSLLCAVLSHNERAIEAALMIAEPVMAAALGLKKGSLAKNIGRLGALVCEAVNLRQNDFAASLTTKIAQNLSEEEALAFAKALEDRLLFPQALAAVEYAALTPEAVFLNGYYRYRCGLVRGASDLIRLSVQMGYDGKDAVSILEDIRTICKNRPVQQKACDKESILSDISGGYFEKSLAEIRALREDGWADADLYSMQANALYYLGRYKQAILAAECGILKFADSVDLLYNAGDIYIKLDKPEKAREHYQKALDLCGDEQISSQIHQAIAALS